MITNNIKTAWRSILKTKSLSFIHILGLAIALATAIVLFLTARFELSYDSFHQDVEHIGLLYSKSQPERGIKYNISMPAPLTPRLKEEIPSIALASRVANGNVILRNGEKQLESINKYVDDDFLSILSFPMLQGDAKALNDIGNIVLDEDMATRLFGQKDVLGKQVEVLENNTWVPKTITAVLETPPYNSTIKFNSLINFEAKPGYAQERDAWDNSSHNVIVKLKDAAVDDVKFSKEVKGFTEQYYKDAINNLKRDGATADKDGNYYSLHLIPLTDYHLSDLGFGNGPPAYYPWILLGIAALLVFIACSNFINLSLANSLIRSREIGTRKTLGGTVKHLIMQLWTEAFLLCLIALGLGLVLAGLLIPEFNASMKYHLSLMDLISPSNLMLFLGMFLMITLLAGGYPAWKIANSNIINSLKGGFSVKSSKLRNTLTVLQFSIAILLIVSTIVISSQLHYIANRPLGFNKSEVISIPIGKGIDHQDALDRMRVALAQESSVKYVSGSDINMGMGNDGTSRNSVFGFTQENREYSTNYMRIDYDYLKTLDIKLLEGRDFDRKFATDSNAIIINKQMAMQFGGADKVLGKYLDLNGKSQVIGIIDDFNFQNLKRSVEPLTISVNPSVFEVEYIFVRVSTDNLAQTLQHIDQIWKKINPQASISPTYLDENTQNLYEGERKFSNIVMTGTGISIFISCMGLFALALLTINRRIKEIGIRKVLGSSVGGLIMLLSKDFMKLVLIAFLIAAPLAWFLMHSWLKMYAYRVGIQWWMFALAAVISVIIAWSTIAWQTFRAARANPVNSLRDE